MNVFDNCRICLDAINHEPIKMTRLILKFVEHVLSLKSVAKPYEAANVKQNLCAGCFNKLAEFQDFFEQCKEADNFWELRFASDKQNKLENCIKVIEEDEVIKVVIADEIVAIKPSNNITNSPQRQQDLEDTSTFVQCDGSSPPEADNLCSIQCHDDVIADSACEEADNGTPVQACIDLDQWSEDKGVECDMGGESSDQKDRDGNEEIIQYDYELEQDNVELSQPEIPTSTMVETENQTEAVCYEFEEIGDSCDTLIQETIEDVLGSEQTEPQEPYEQEIGENTYFETTTVDESGKVKKSYQCQHCDRSFDRVYDIESHYNIHSDIKPYVCDVCGRSFRQKNILTTHQALHFGKKIECPECGKKFARRSQLILHFRMHRDEKPFVCEFDGCEAAFRQRQHLVDHSFIHTGEKNFQCSSCHKTFHTRKRLQDHMYKVHSSHRYGCDMCDKAFLKPHMLKNHLLNTHNCEVNDVSHLKVSIEQLKPSKRNNTNF